MRRERSPPRLSVRSREFEAFTIKVSVPLCIMRSNIHEFHGLDCSKLSRTHVYASETSFEYYASATHDSGILSVCWNTVAHCYDIPINQSDYSLWSNGTCYDVDYVEMWRMQKQKLPIVKAFTQYPNVFPVRIFLPYNFFCNQETVCKL